jgi:hypothetical protein
MSGRKFRRRWRYPIRGSVVAALTALVGAPVAHAAPAQDTVVFGPIRIRAYELLITGYPRQGRHSATALVDLYRHAGKPVHGLPGIFAFSQTHTFLAARGVQIEIAPNLSSAHLRVNLGDYGRINLTVSSSHTQHSRGCPRHAQTGRADGHIRLTPGGRYFGTITAESTTAAIANVSGCETSADAQPMPAASPVIVATSSPGHVVGFDTADGWTITMSRPGRAVEVQDMIQANMAPTSAVSATPDLSQATVRAIGPFLSGFATYVATTPLRSGQTDGTLSGTLTARFDSPGPVDLTDPPLQASLYSGP